MSEFASVPRDLSLSLSLSLAPWLARFLSLFLCRCRGLFDLLFPFLCPCVLAFAHDASMLDQMTMPARKTGDSLAGLVLGGLVLGRAARRLRGLFLHLLELFLEVLEHISRIFVLSGARVPLLLGLGRGSRA